MYNPDSVQVALQKQLEMVTKNKVNADKLREYVEAKSLREMVSKEKSGKCLEEDEETLDRRGKKRLFPVHLSKYYEKLEQLKKRNHGVISPELSKEMVSTFDDRE